MRESFKCENCGQKYTDSHELISLSGENFCGNCSDEFHFINDPLLGVIALPETNPDPF